MAADVKPNRAIINFASIPGKNGDSDVSFLFGGSSNPNTYAEESRAEAARLAKLAASKIQAARQALATELGVDDVIDLPIRISIGNSPLSLGADLTSLENMIAADYVADPKKTGDEIEARISTRDVGYTPLIMAEDKPVGRLDVSNSGLRGQTVDRIADAYRAALAEVKKQRRSDGYDYATDKDGFLERAAVAGFTASITPELNTFKEPRTP